jgi:CheY-like chemotaxis protein
VNASSRFSHSQEATARIRALGYTGPIVVATGNVIKGNAFTSLQAVGVTEALTKPITKQNIASMIQKYIPELGT